MTREGDRDGWKMGCFSEAEDDGGLLQGIAECVCFLGCFPNCVVDLHCLMGFVV